MDNALVIGRLFDAISCGAVNNQGVRQTVKASFAVLTTSIFSQLCCVLSPLFSLLSALCLLLAAVLSVVSRKCMRQIFKDLFLVFTIATPTKKFNDTTTTPM
jgi:hypothetical protein